MNDPAIFDDILLELREQVAARTMVPVAPMAISPWVAMSLLQKSIRRGRTGLALRAAATLYLAAPDRLWRRLGGIGFEDVGLAALSILPHVTVALGGKRLRQSCGGEWQVVAYLIEKLCGAAKCRAADDLLMVAELHPAFVELRTGLGSLELPGLLDLVLSKGSAPMPAIAMWYALGTDRRSSPNLVRRHGDPHAVFNTMFEAGWPQTLVEVCREGFRRTREVLAPFVLLLSREFREEMHVIAPDQMRDEVLINEVPEWAFDQYSREGKTALRLFLEHQCATTRWLSRHLDTDARLPVLGNLLFRIEGGVVDLRLRWRLGDELRVAAETGANGGGCPDANEAISLLKEDFDLFREVRVHACRCSTMTTIVDAPLGKLLVSFSPNGVTVTPSLLRTEHEKIFTTAVPTLFKVGSAEYVYDDNEINDLLPVSMAVDGHVLNLSADSNGTWRSNSTETQAAVRDFDGKSEISLSYYSLVSGKMAIPLPRSGMAEAWGSLDH